MSRSQDNGRAPEQHPTGAGRSASAPRGLRWSRLALAGAVALVVAASGCHKPLFPEGTPRTPFEMHDRMRDRSRPLTEPDVFGRPQPALRARLGQQDQ